MKQEIRARIEQIRQGIVPEGYVKDKDGIYPRDWASKKIGQWLKLAERSIVLQDEEEYQLVTIRRGFGGVDSRGSFLGKNVLVKNYFIVKTGDFIISKRQIAHGACGIVPPELDGAVVSNEYNVFLPQDGTNIQMFNLMMQLPHYKRLFYLMSDGVHIEKLLFKTQDWMKRTLAMPLLKEQKKIAEILSTQDKAIELQGRKIEELKRFKKGCLEKMFPRKGQKVPETRFPGFTGDWEQRKVSTIASDTRGGGTPATSNETYWSGNIPWIQSSDLSEGKLFGVEPRKYISRDGLNNSATQLVPENSIAVVTRVGVGKLAFMPFSYTTSQDFLSLCKLQTEPHFTVYALYQMLQGELQAVQGTSIKGMTKDDLLSKSIFAPKDEVEQQQLGSYFRNLDTLITLHQRKLEEMKKQKKALMQLLLTGIVKTKGEVR